LEASIRESRIIAQSKPPFNAVGKRTEKSIWIRITNEPYPRLSVVRKITEDALHFGPVRSMEQATLVIDAITTLIGIRTCTTKLSVKKASPSCVLGEMGKCALPCELAISTDDYKLLIEQLKSAINGDSFIESNLQQRISQLASQERFEEAAAVRDRLQAWLSAAIRFHRLKTISRISEIIAVATTETGFDIHIIRYGALAAAGTTTNISDIGSEIAAMKSTAQEFLPPLAPAGAGSISEAMMICNWLDAAEVMLIETSEPLAQSWPNQLSAQDIFEELTNAQNKSSSVSPTRKWQNFSAPK
jgi:DNA polymerase-3 subunit epsilon